jgi:hypothetical protein
MTRLCRNTPHSQSKARTSTPGYKWLGCPASRIPDQMILYPPPQSHTWASKPSLVMVHLSPPEIEKTRYKDHYCTVSDLSEVWTSEVRRDTADSRSIINPTLCIMQGETKTPLQRTEGNKKSKTLLKYFMFILCSSFRASWINSKKFQRDDTLVQYFLFLASCSTCFGWNIDPSSGAQLNCIYSIWCWQTVCDLPSSWMSRNSSRLTHDDGRSHTVCHYQTTVYSSSWW